MDTIYTDNLTTCLLSGGVMHVVYYCARTFCAMRPYENYTKFKIYSKGEQLNYMKIYTNENFLLYGIACGRGEAEDKCNK